MVGRRLDRRAGLGIGASRARDIDAGARLGGSHRRRRRGARATRRNGDPMRGAAERAEARSTSSLITGEDEADAARESRQNNLYSIYPE